MSSSSSSSSPRYPDLLNPSDKLISSESSDTTVDDRCDDEFDFEYGVDESKPFDLMDRVEISKFSSSSADDDELPSSSADRRRSSDHLECKECAEKFTDPITYWQHMTSYHDTSTIPDPKPIEAVRKIIESTSTIKIKLESAEDDDNDTTKIVKAAVQKPSNELICDTCGKTYSTVIKLHRHIGQVHTKPKSRQHIIEFCSKFVISEGDMLCDQCPFRCGHLRRYKMMEHYRIHSGERPHDCILCDKSFRTKAILSKHVTTVHDDRKLYICDTCGKSFSERRSMEEHFRTHTKEKPFVCDSCGAQFTQQSSLVSHKKSHDNRRTYQCEICQAAFNTNSVLVRHIRTHSTHKPHRCDQCGKSFSSNDLLKRHKVVHSQETPFSCQLCDARFKLKRYLQQHEKVHEKRV